MLDKRAKKDNFARETCNGDLPRENPLWRAWGYDYVCCVR